MISYSTHTIILCKSVVFQSIYTFVLGVGVGLSVSYKYCYENYINYFSLQVAVLPPRALPITALLIHSCCLLGQEKNIIFIISIIYISHFKIYYISVYIICLRKIYLPDATNVALYFPLTVDPVVAAVLSMSLLSTMEMLLSSNSTK